MYVLVFSVLSALYLQNVQSQLSLIETGGGVKKAGESLRLNCKVSGKSSDGNGFSNYHMIWVRQRPGGGLEWISFIYYDSSSKYYLSSVKDRFTISRDNSQTLLYLDMKDLKPEDTATYYCAVYWWGLEHWGQGTHLTVTSATPGEPSLLSISPCCNIPASQNPLQIGCFVTSDSPSKKIQWFKGSSQISANVKQYPEVYNNGRYSFSSVLNVNSADLNTYECRFDSQTEHLKKRDCGCPQKNPEIELYMASCNPDDTKAMYLLCRVSSFLPEDIEVAWFKGARTPIIDFIFTGNKTEVNPCFFHTVSRVKITAEEWSTGIHFTCLVTQSGKPFQKEISSCSACPKPSPKIEWTGPSYEELFMRKSAVLKCNITTTLKNTEAILKTDDRVLATTQWKSAVTADNATWNLVISHTVSVEEWTKKNFTCEARHACQTHNQILKHKEMKEEKKKPSVSILTHETSRFYTLICHVSEYYPEELFVKWEVNGHPVNIAINSPADYDEATKSYSMQSTLHIPKVNISEESVWSCKVGHSTLTEMITVRKEKPFAQSAVPPNVAISEPSPDKNNEQLLNIECIAYGFYPKKISIQWLTQEPEKLRVNTSDQEQGETGTYSIRSTLIISKEQWNEGRYSCDVRHEATKTRILRNTTNVHARSEYLPATEVYTIEPSYEDIVIKRKAKLTCLVLGHELDSVNVTWIVNDRIITEGVYVSTAERHSNGTETVKGLLEIHADDWLSGRKYSCKVAHSSLPTPKLSDTWFKEGSPETKTKIRAPEVNLRLPTPEEVKKDENLTLICLIENYFPDYVFVQWRSNNTAIESSKYRNSDSYFDHKTNAYTMDSKLVVQTKDWADAKTYICMVHHISSTWPILKEGNKHTGKPTTVNLSVYLTDGKSECHI